MNFHIESEPSEEAFEGFFEGSTEWKYYMIESLN